MDKSGYFFIACLIVFSASLTFSGLTYAGWSEPVFLSELNDYEEMQYAVQPSISSDGLSLFFVRRVPSLAQPLHNQYFIVEAKRQNPEEHFWDQTILTYLGNTVGAYIENPWISHDGLRLYYAEARNYGGRWQRLVCMATRHSPADHWVRSRIFTELHTIERDSTPSLTKDELTIMWLTENPTVTDETIIFTATRSSPTGTFNNIREVDELNELQAKEPFMTASGLSVFFTLKDESGYLQIWRGTRDSLDRPFGDFEPLNDINLPTMNMRFPCVSPDEKTLYFFQGHPDMPAVERGIFVSHWVECPYETAMDNLRQAADLKQQAEEMVSESIDLELEALRLLSELRPNDLPQGIVIQDVRRARIALLRAVQRQIIARMNLARGIELLGEALFGLTPPQQDELLPEEPPVRHPIGIRRAETRTELPKRVTR